MRIKLKKGFQNKLIVRVKGNKTWNEIEDKLGVNQHHLALELKNEKGLLSDRIYKKTM